jgi:hypothetical protein
MKYKFYIAFWDFGEWDEMSNTRCRTKFQAELLLKKLSMKYPPASFEGHTLRIMEDVEK